MHVRFVGEPDDGTSVSSHHAAVLSRAGVEVSFDGVSGEGRSDRSAPDVIHLVTHEQRDGALLRRLVAERMAGVPIVRCWTERGLIWATHHRPTGDFARAASQLGVVQLCRTTQARDALRDIGIDARVIPVISPHLSLDAQPRPMPREFTVLCYLPSRRREYHGGAIVDALVRSLPAIRFLILGDVKERYVGYRTVEALGEAADPTRAMQRASVVVDARLDGALSRIMLEALCHGRHVISAHPLPHARLARTAAEYIEAVRSLRGDAAFNLSGREYVCREHDPSQAVKTMRRILDEAAEPGRLNLAVEGGVRAAAAMIRNLSLFGKQPFEFPAPETLPPQARLLRTLLEVSDEASIVTA